jgi:hypothetical protein
MVHLKRPSKIQSLTGVTVFTPTDWAAGSLAFAGSLSTPQAEAGAGASDREQYKSYGE